MHTTYKVIDSFKLGEKSPTGNRYYTMTGESERVDEATVFESLDIAEAMSKARELNQGRKKAVES